MPETIQVALIGLIGSGLGSLVGILVNSKLTNYRIDKLEENVNKINKTLDGLTNINIVNSNQQIAIEHLQEENKRIIDDIRDLKKAQV